MPSRYLCDYCDVFLTHDSASVRRAHNAGRNHLSNVRDYYASLGNDRVQELIDQICAAYEHGGGQARILQIGADGLPMGAPVGAIAMGGNVGMPHGSAPPSQSISLLDRVFAPSSNLSDLRPGSVRFAGPPIANGFPGMPPAPGGPPMGPPGAGAYGSPFPPSLPPGGAAGAPPPIRFVPSGPTVGAGQATFSAPPTGPPPPAAAAAASASSPPPPPPASNAKLINGLNPERAKMLGLI
ncbi:hypothetical protein JCM3766R1_001342 [Sporobolomyces carnicolor]